MTIPGFLLQNKFKRVGVFKKIFLLVDTSIEVILKIFFLTLFNRNIYFIEKKLI